MAASKKAAKAPAKTNRTLLVVESPSKARIISKYLGSKYKVIASVGHVRDLPKSRLGVDIENNFEPEYINIRGKGDTIKEIKKEAAASSKVLLATDPDREGRRKQRHHRKCCWLPTLTAREKQSRGIWRIFWASIRIRSAVSCSTR